MQISASFHMMDLQDNITIAATRRSCNNVLVECEWDKENQREKIDNCTHGAHCLWSIKATTCISAKSLSIAIDWFSYISGLFGFAISLPFNPAFINTGPSHRIRLNATAKATPLKASEASNGASSPSKLLFIMKPTQAPIRARRPQASRGERAAAETIASRAHSTTPLPNCVPSSKSEAPSGPHIRLQDD